jgi:membrane protein implicated in regulation of membrane protease activity
MFGHVANLKKRTASKAPIGWFPILVVVVPCLWGLCFWYWDWPLAVITALISVYLVVDAWNLIRKKRAAQKEPKPLKKEGLGT